MVTIVTRTSKGSALTTAEMDSNLTNLNTKVELDDISVTTGAEAETAALSYNNATGVFTFTPVATDDLVVLDDFSVTTGSPSGAGALSYNNTTGVFTFQAADVSLLPFIETIDEDDAPALGGNLDVGTNEITTTTANGHIVIKPIGTGTVKAYGALDTISGTVTTSTTNGHLNLSANGTGNIRIGQALTHQTTDADFNIDANGDGMINLNGPVHIDDLTSFAETIDTLISVSGTLSLDAQDGPIKYVVPSGAMTINGFVSPVSGQTITLLIDQATGSSNFTFTLGAGLLTPSGDGVTLTDSGYDLVTITCADATNGLYIVTSINDFQ